MNVMENIPEYAPEELFEILLEAQGVRIERIVSYGQTTTEGFWYDQDENEWVMLIEGSARIGYLDEPGVELRAGDCLLIPAGCRHRVEQTDQNAKTIWLAVFYK